MFSPVRDTVLPGGRGSLTVLFLQRTLLKSNLMGKALFDAEVSPCREHPG